MKSKLNRRTFVIGTGALFLAQNSLVSAETTHEVQSYIKHPDDPKRRNVFDPLVTVVEPGDTVTFVATEKTHNSVSIKGMIPEGAEEWKGKINKDISVRFDKPGVYGYQCQPHAALGMVGLIIVKGEGMTDNLEAAKAVKQRGKAKGVFEEIWAQVEAENLLA